MARLIHPSIKSTLAVQPPVEADVAAIWQAGRVLDDRGVGVQWPDADRAGLRPQGGPADENQAGADSTVAGPTLAAPAITAGLVDGLQLFVEPVVVGGGKEALPGNVPLPLELLDGRRFGNMVYPKVPNHTVGAPGPRSAFFADLDGIGWSLQEIRLS